MVKPCKGLIVPPTWVASSRMQNLPFVIYCEVVCLCCCRHFETEMTLPNFEGNLLDWDVGCIGATNASWETSNPVGVLAFSEISSNDVDIFTYFVYRLLAPNATNLWPLIVFVHQHWQKSQIWLIRQTKAISKRLRPPSAIWLRILQILNPPKTQSWCQLLLFTCWWVHKVLRSSIARLLDLRHLNSLLTQTSRGFHFSGCTQAH